VDLRIGTRRSRRTPVEKMWALYYAGAGREFRAVLRDALEGEESVGMQFAYVWLLVRSHGMEDALAWVAQKERSAPVLELRKRLLLGSVSMLAGIGGCVADDGRHAGEGSPHRRRTPQQ